VCFAIGVMGLAYVALETVAGWLGRDALGWFDVNRAFLAALVMVLLGGQFMSLGLVAELIVANYDRSTDAYSIAATTPCRADEVIVSPGASPSGVTSLTAAQGVLSKPTRSRAS
jgi:hypothetical protein